MDLAPLAPDSTLPRMARLFVALWPSAGTRRALEEQRRRWNWPERAALVAPEAMHLTLQFIGPVPLPDVPHVAEALRVPARPFTLTFADARVWPNGVAVLEPNHVPSGLHDLVEGLRGALGRLGLPVESRPYKPHVTLARNAAGAVPPDAMDPPLIWRAVAGYTLVQSRHGYHVLQRYPCGDPLSA
ncbi:MAG TPA: RNA 2',3'-cyclic phosphodiesterase [Burkholderiaceae bacterium]|nr:RNA 2',3'-cyclic phosphodiesterase [Burkholderiaceae bacterium]